MLVGKGKKKITSLGSSNQLSFKMCSSDCLVFCTEAVLSERFDPAVLEAPGNCHSLVQSGEILGWIAVMLWQGKPGVRGNGFLHQYHNIGFSSS